MGYDLGDPAHNGDPLLETFKDGLDKSLARLKPYEGSTKGVALNVEPAQSSHECRPTVPLRARYQRDEAALITGHGLAVGGGLVMM